MGSPVIWSGTFAKILSSAGMLFKNGLALISGSANPSAVATSAAKGSLYMSDLGRLYQKQDAGLSSNWLPIDFSKAQRVTVAKSGGDYTSIQGAVDSITDASPTKPYLIDVYPGIYTGDVAIKDDTYLRGRVVGDMPCAVIEGRVTGTCASASSVMGVYDLTIRNTPTAGKREALALSGPGSYSIANVSAYLVGVGDFEASVVKLTTITAGTSLSNVTAYDTRSGAITANSTGLEFSGSGPLLLNGVRSTCSHSRASGIATGIKCSTTGNVSAFSCFSLFSNLAASFSGEAVGFEYTVGQTAGRVRNTTEFFARFINTAGTCTATLFKGSGTSAIQHVKSSMYSSGFTTNRINSVDAETSHFIPDLSSNVLIAKAGNGTAIITPADNVVTGFVEWSPVDGVYWTYVAATRTFTVARRGAGLINSVPVVWAGGQSVVLADFATNFVYVDTSGTVRTTTTANAALYENNIVLFEPWAQNLNSIIVKENHPAKFNTSVSIAWHNLLGALLQSGNSLLAINGVATNREIDFLGPNTLTDHGLDSTIPAMARVSWRVMGRRASDGKMYQYGNLTQLLSKIDVSTTLTTVAAGAFVTGRAYEIRTPGSTNFTLIGAENSLAKTCFVATGPGTGTGDAYQLTTIPNAWVVYRLGVVKDSIQSPYPTFIAVLHNASYGNETAARNAIAAGSILAFPAEAEALEIVRVGYAIINGNAGGTGTMVTPVTDLEVFRSASGGGGSSTSGGLILLNTTNFGGQFAATEANVQSLADRADDYGYIPAWVATTATYRVGNVVKQYGSVYRCITAHTASAAFATDIANWEQVSIAKFATVAAAEAASGSDNELCYVVETETLYRFEDSGSSFTDDNLWVLSTGAGGNTRWLGVAGKYDRSRKLSESAVIIVAGDPISLSSAVGSERSYAVIGSSAGQNAMSSTPFSFTGTPPAEPMTVWIIGRSNTSTVTLATNDAAEGALIAGGFIELGKGTAICLKYSPTLARWIEIARNNATF